MPLPSLIQPCKQIAIVSHKNNSNRHHHHGVNPTPHHQELHSSTTAQNVTIQQNGNLLLTSSTASDASALQHHQYHSHLHSSATATSSSAPINTPNDKIITVTPLSLTHSQIPHLMHHIPSIPIPNTVLFSSSLISSSSYSNLSKEDANSTPPSKSSSAGIPEWLFYSKKKRKVMRKHAYHVTNEAIWKELVDVEKPGASKKKKAASPVQPPSPSNAIYALPGTTSTVSSPEQQDDDETIHLLQRTAESTPVALVFHWHQDVLGDTHFSIDVLNARRLDWYLERQHKRHDSIEMLQQFIEPKGEYDNFIRVLWTYKVCLMDKYVNRYKWKDSSVHLSKRISIENENLVIGSEITHEERLICHKMCDMIIAHIKKKTKKLHQLSHLAFTCKQDKNGVMHFLWFDSIRTTTEPVSGLKAHERDDFKLSNILYSLSGDFSHGWPCVSLQTAAVMQASKSPSNNKKRKKKRAGARRQKLKSSRTSSDTENSRSSQATYQRGASDQATSMDLDVPLSPHYEIPSVRSTQAHRRNGGTSQNSNSIATVPPHILLTYTPSTTLPYVKDPYSNSLVHTNILLYHQQLYNSNQNSSTGGSSIMSVTNNQQYPIELSNMFDSRLTLRQQSDPVCSICEKRYDLSLQHHLEYDSIIKYHEQKRSRDGGDTHSSFIVPHPSDIQKSHRTLTLEKVVPREIFRNEPSMSVEEFKEAKLDTAFLHRTLAVCEQCHRQYTDAITSTFTLPNILRSKVFEKTMNKKRNDQMKTYTLGGMRSTHEAIHDYQRRIMREKRARSKLERQSLFDVLV